MRIRSTVFLAAFTAAVACGKNSAPPPPPRLDPVLSPTSLTRIAVTGSAQYGAKISVTGAAAVEPAEISADDYTARFRAVVTLNKGVTNTLNFTATDHAGNISAPATLTIDQNAGYAVSLANVKVNGTACVLAGTPAACLAAPGDTIDFDLVTNATVSLSEVQFTIFFASLNRVVSQRLLVASNATLPLTSHFNFNVPGGALPEDTSLVGLAVDGQGNRTTSTQLILRVQPFSTGGRSAAIIAVNGPISGPNDIAFNAAGDMFIGDDGNGDLLRVAAGGSTPTVFSGYASGSRYLSVDSSNRVYVSDGGRLWQVDPTGATVTNYVTFPGLGAGLALDSPTFAKGLVDASAAVAGSTVTVGALTYEFRASGTTCAVNVCVNLTAANKSQALASAVAANSVEANAVFDSGANRAVLSAKTAGAAGNTIVLTASAGITVTGGGKLAEGHDENLFLGQNADNNIYRLAGNLTPTPSTLASADSLFNVLNPQRGVAVRDLTTAASPNLRDLVLYYVDDGAPNRLRGFHAVDSTTPSQVFVVGAGGGLPFNKLYDVVLQPIRTAPAGGGCLLASDEGNGRIYAIDTRNPATTPPAVTLVASGFAKPRGLALFNGDLYVADNNLNLIVKISPLAGAPCF